MALDGLSPIDRERATTAIFHLRDDQDPTWIYAHSHKLPSVTSGSGSPLWIMRIGNKLRLLYSNEHDEHGARVILIHDVAPHDRIDVLRRPYGDRR